jgi:hypothetical protein
MGGEVGRTESGWTKRFWWPAEAIPSVRYPSYIPLLFISAELDVFDEIARTCQ